jgi:hypothetical protein
MHCIVDAFILQLSQYGSYVSDGWLRKKWWLNRTVFFLFYVTGLLLGSQSNKLYKEMNKYTAVQFLT